MKFDNFLKCIGKQMWKQIWKIVENLLSKTSLSFYDGLAGCSIVIFFQSFPERPGPKFQEYIQLSPHCKFHA